MTTPEHPVTLGDLRVNCEHGSQNEHLVWDLPHNPTMKKVCPGGHSTTVADLVSALRAEGVLVVEKVDGEWPEWVKEVARDINRSYAVVTSGRFSIPVDSVLNVLIERQP